MSEAKTGGPARTRFAPSPTGYLHIGSLRTVLFDWLLARGTGGQFVLRIEDTDRNRYVEGAEANLVETLRLMGYTWDEGPGAGGPHAPYKQSERLPIYHRYAEQLLASGHVYRCFCTPERLKQVNEAKIARKEPPGYDRHCRFLSQEEREQELASGKPHVLRLAVPLDGETTCEDLLRGPIVVANRTLSDPVLLKSDGFPTYHLAAIVDDHEMQITHVLRADEWLPTFPIHVLLYQFLGWPQPIWAHMPQVLGPDSKKLSKRHGDTSVMEYLQRGYLPEAITNCLAMIGWGYDETTEIMSRDELIERFSLERVSPSGGVFSIDKLNWFNGVYIRRLSPEELVERLIPYMQAAKLIGDPLDDAERTYLQRLTPLIQERLVTLSEAPDLLRFVFEAPRQLDPAELVPKKLDQAAAARALAEARGALAEIDPWNEENLETRLRALAEELGLKTGDLFMTLRVAATGSKVSPPLFQTLDVLGKDEVLRRIDFALGQLEPVASGR
jgi:glutamyl-tRNA synthetase